MNFIDIAGQAISHEQIVVSSAAAVELPPGRLHPAGSAPIRAVLITTRGANISFRIDSGAMPTATVGHLLRETDALVIHGIPNLIRFRMIAVTATANVDVTYLR